MYILSYKTLLQRTFILLLGIDFFVIGYFLAWVNPTQSQGSFWLFFLWIWLFLLAGIFLLNLWWSDKILKKFLNQSLINHILLRSLGLSIAITYLLFLNLIQENNIFVMFAVALGIFCYIFWMS